MHEGHGIWGLLGVPVGLQASPPWLQQKSLEGGDLAHLGSGVSVLSVL